MYPNEGPSGVGGNKSLKHPQKTNNKADITNKPSSQLGGYGSLFDVNDPKRGGTFWIDINDATAQGLTVQVNSDGKGGKTSIFSDGSVGGYGIDNNTNYYDFTNSRLEKEKQIKGYETDLENILSDGKTKVKVAFEKDGVFKATYPDGTFKYVDSTGKPIDSMNKKDKSTVNSAKVDNSTDKDLTNADKLGNTSGNDTTNLGKDDGLNNSKLNGYTKPGVILTDIEDALKKGQSVEIGASPDSGRRNAL